MDKDLLLEEIENFIVYHKQQHLKLDYFIEGIIDNTESVLLDISDCEMQRWLYERKVILNNLYNSTNMKDLHSYHEDWHESFEKIALLLDIRQLNKSFFQKITGKNNIQEIYEKEKDKIDVYIEELEESNRLINVKLSMMRQRLMAMPLRVFNENI